MCDVDSERMLLRGERGKGGQYRNAMLPAGLRPLLREWWKAGRQQGVMHPDGWLFRGQRYLKPLSTRQRDCQDFPVWVAGGTLRRDGFDEALAEDDGELGLGHGPLAWRHFPLFFGSVQDQVERLGDGLIAGEVTPRAHRPAQLGVERLYSVVV